MLRFGPWSTTLGLAAAFGALVALLLWCARGNRSAQRLLALLLIVAVLRLMPYVLGFAGAYDLWPWLSFAPFDLRLAIGPLLYLYLLRLATPALPPRWGWHLAPAALDLNYMLWAFALPLAQKHAWEAQVHGPWISPLQDVAGALSLGLYLVLAARLRRRYLDWLHEHVSDRDAQRQPWVASVLLALGLWLLVSTGFDLYSALVAPLTYYDRFPQYLAFSSIILWLGLEGWRHAGRAFPPMRPLTPAAPAGRDWQATADAWHARIRDEGWWRQPGLSLADVAQRLGTNESYVSRAFNGGLGRNFNGAINALRVDAVQAGMRDDPTAELLALGLDCGFSSKASFNRVFREQTGMSPSAWRAAHITKHAAPTAFEATPATRQA
ncbi:AraC family transcriptional regulator [Massilia aurea]|uniref:helix-turn-helix domain-containing protein n=1 Tax=Massilia aurea TaxID=373040 RepID=UPI00346198B5